MSGRIKRIKHKFSTYVKPSNCVVIDNCYDGHMVNNNNAVLSLCPGIHQQLATQYVLASVPHLQAASYVLVQAFNQKKW